MNFLIKIKSNSDWYNFNVTFKPEDCRKSENCLLIQKSIGSGRYKEISVSEKLIYILGDLVYPDNIRDAAGIESFWADFKPENLQKLRGFFYIIILDIKQSSLQVFNSVFSLLPVLYSTQPGEILVSSRNELIRNTAEHSFDLDKTYILEKALFNYSLFNNTYLKNISLLPSNSFLSISKSDMSIHRHTRISDHFSESIRPWKKSVDEISELFIRRTESMIPSEHFYHSLTGGLDGRTLLAISLKNSASLTTYSYGSSVTPDVAIPQHIAGKLGFRHEVIGIDENYAATQFDVSARELVKITEGAANVSRSHYHMMAEYLGKKTGFTFSGNFGSELLRPVKNDGGILGTDEFFRLFSTTSDAEIRDLLLKSRKLHHLNLDFFNRELDDLVEKVIQFKSSLDKEFASPNFAFYSVLTEELFRQYFGPELVLINQYYAQRCPFLDFEWIKALLKTELAGCNSAYLENNPLKRFRGQILYPVTIKKSFPQLLDFDLDRRYPPRYLLSNAGNMMIAFMYYYRKVFDRNRHIPSYSRYYKDNLEKISLTAKNHSGLFDIENMLKTFREAPSEMPSYSNSATMLLYTDLIQS